MSPIVRSLGCLLVLAMGAVGAVSPLPAGDREPAKPAQSAPAKIAPGGIIVSRETTFITGPLRKDGSVDYLAALNQRWSQGVTPENNAAVLLIQALGPGETNKDTPERFFQMLGIPRIAEKGAYLEPSQAYIERKSTGAAGAEKGQETDAAKLAFEQHLQIMDRPWSKKEFPIAASWLDENAKQIDLIVAATKRPRYYVPLVTTKDEPGMLIAALLPLITQSREAARALNARAMFRIGSGQADEAWQDLLACHRLARLVSQGPTLIDMLVGIAIEGLAIHGDGMLVHEGKLTAEQARRFAGEFRQLPPMGKMVDKINGAERFMLLDCVTAIACKGPAEIGRLDGGRDGKGTWDWLTKVLAIVFIDWNEPMRMGNHWYDRLAAVLSKPTGKQRDAAVAEFDRQFRQLIAGAKDPRALLGNIASAGSLRVGLGRQMGQVFLALLMPAVQAAMNAEDRGTVNGSMVPVAFALATYRADHKSYPTDLAALVPQYLPAIPEDLFSGGPLRYKREGPGYVLYSVGRNGKDDGGRAYWDEPDSERNLDHDDIAIRVPAKKK
jgi:hypothetical protein